MDLTKEQFDRISCCLPRQRGNVCISNHQLVNALLYITENGCKWRTLPKSYGNWHTIYMRMNRWSNSGVWNPAVIFSLSSGSDHDSPQGELLLERMQRLPEQIYMQQSQRAMGI